MDYRERINSSRRLLAGWLSYAVMFGCLLHSGHLRAAGNFDAATLAEIDAAIESAIAAKSLPGGVFWLERHGMSYVKAYGNRSLEPEVEAMTEDTIFDAASLTKVIATTSAIMMLAEQGKIRLQDTVRRWIPDFRGQDTASITIHHLLTHTSGLKSGLDPTPPWSGYYKAIEKACQEPALTMPGTAFRYSDINFILLGEIVRRASGRKLSEFTSTEIFTPLGMTDTGYLPAKSKRPRIAPTEVAEAGVLRGVVHDPTARRMGGVAGHAGLFTTAQDLAKFARVMLNRGEWNGVRLFKTESVILMTMVQTPAKVKEKRGLGWDIDSPYAGLRGEVFPMGSYGHTGWTGTSIWIDPSSDTFWIFLSNRNHPDESGSVVELRKQLGTLAAQAVRGITSPEPSPAPGLPSPLPEPVPAPEPAEDEEKPVEIIPSDAVPDTEPIEAEPAAPEEAVPSEAPEAGVSSASPVDEPPAIEMTPYVPPVLNGIDVLAKQDFAPLQGLRLGLISNHTGVDHRRRRTIDLLHEAEDVDLKVLFSPEHGLQGKLDSKVSDGEDATTGLPIISLYGERRAPTSEQLEGLDALVFDIQDVGCRFYTYVSTMGLCMEAAARAGLAFYVLDRVNPITGSGIEGPIYEGESEFVAFHSLPLRHGMTVGELAVMFAAEREWDLELKIIPLEGWLRSMWFDQTGLPWVNPSPNMRNLKEAILYPGLGLLETAVSVGRGTDIPFEVIGAPFVDDTKLASDLNGLAIDGVRFVPIRFTPRASVFAGKECGGVYVLLTDRNHLPSVDVGIAIAGILRRDYPETFEMAKLNRLLLDANTMEMLGENANLSKIKSSWKDGLTDFKSRRSKYLMYN